MPMLPAADTRGGRHIIRRLTTLIRRQPTYPTFMSNCLFIVTLLGLQLKDSTGHGEISSNNQICVPE